MEQLRALDVGATTPVQALQLLEQWQQDAKSN